MSYFVSIIGLGFVGDTIYKSFKLNNINTYGYDKYKNGGIGSLENTLNSDFIFLALPTPFDEKINKYNIQAIHETCTLLKQNNYQGLVVIKSTIEPETTQLLSNEYKLQFVHNPEFLTTRTAFQNFHNQKHIILGKGLNCLDSSLNKLVDFYIKYYPQAEISICSSLEAESTKLFCNSFYAVKVQFFTELYELCVSNGCNYEIVKKMMLNNGWINEQHTTIPGPDGKISYSGTCFPKDTCALNSYMKSKNASNKILDACIRERDEMRKN